MELGECYELEGGRNLKGYGRLQVGSTRTGNFKIHSAHRVAWMAVNGPIPEGGQILHHCDNRACIRASHLYLGNNDDNVRDRVMRMRSARRLTDEEVAEIRRLYSRYGTRFGGTGLSGRELAARYGTSKSHISRIVNGWQRKSG